MEHIEEFITERKYLKNVSPKTVDWYRQSFKSFNGADSKAAIIARIADIRRCREFRGVDELL